jgi:hypothetical protein
MIVVNVFAAVKREATNMDVLKPTNNRKACEAAMTTSIAESYTSSSPSPSVTSGTWR